MESDTRIPSHFPQMVPNFTRDDSGGDEAKIQVVTNWRKVGADAVPVYLPLLPEPSSVPISVPTQLATILYTNLPPTALAMIAMDHRRWSVKIAHGPQIVHTESVSQTHTIQYNIVHTKSKRPKGRSATGFLFVKLIMTVIELILAGMAYNVRRARTSQICLIVNCVLQVGKTGESVSYLFGF